MVTKSSQHSHMANPMMHFKDLIIILYLAPPCRDFRNSSDERTPCIVIVNYINFIMVDEKARPNAFIYALCLYLGLD